MKRIANYIGGEFVGPSGGRFLPVFEPATGSVYAETPASDDEDVERAVSAAVRATTDWSALTGGERGRHLSRIADAIEREIEQLALAESIDTGKPISLARTVDIPRAAANFRFFAGAGEHFAGESHALGRTAINYTLRQPVGVAGCISPWNLPLYLFTWKIAPALAAGNAVVAKPSEMTPVTASILAELCHGAGLPPGVLNIVQGTGVEAGRAIVAHPHVPAISFTGGTITGREISAVAAPLLKKLSLELGGKNPNIIFADCPYERMLETTIRSSFSNQGQICLCGSRILVETPLYERFKKDFVERVSALKVGDPLDPDTDVGAVISAEHLEKVAGYLKLALAEGGRVLCGGSMVQVKGRCSQGWFVQPTVVEGLPNRCRTNQEEIFGPIVTIQPFDNELEALQMANDTIYGLAAIVWTKDLDRAHRISARLQAGIVWVNCWMVRDLRTPFGGMKASGVGREGGLEALRFFTEARNVCIHTPYETPEESP